MIHPQSSLTGEPVAVRFVPVRDRVLDAVEFIFRVPRATLLSRSRRHAVVVARHACCAALRARGWSLSRIGAALSLHHTSVLNALRCNDARCERDEDLALMVALLISEVVP